MIAPFRTTVQDFSTLGVLTLWRCRVCVCVCVCVCVYGEGCLMHGRMFSNMPGLDPQGANSTLLRVVTTKNISRHCHMSPVG